MVSEPTSQARCGWDAGCLSGLKTYLPGTLGNRCRLFKPCQYLGPRQCGAGMQAVQAVSEPSSQALWGRGAGCLSRLRTYLPGTVRQGCRLFKQCWNLPLGHDEAGVHAV